MLGKNCLTSLRMRVLSSLLFLAVSCFGQEALKLGAVTVFPDTRSIVVPAKVNMEQGILEFALVNKKGKVHEALFTTEVKCTELNAALKLIGYKSDDSDMQSLPSLESLEGFQQVKIEVLDRGSWGPISDYITHTEKGAFDSRWVYTGSFFYKGRFAALQAGDYIAIYFSPVALINLDHSDRENDMVWMVNEGKGLKKGAVVMLRFSMSP